MVDKLREQILAANDELRTVSSILKMITIAEKQEDRRHTKMAYNSLCAYQKGVSKEDVRAPELEAPRDPENVAEHYSQLRSDLADAKPELEAQQTEVRKRTIGLLEELLDTLSVDGETKKSQIIALKEALQSNFRGDLIATVIDCSTGYPGKFKWDDEQACVVPRKNVETRRQNQFSDSQKEKIKQRDEYMCVKCGAESQLQVHHIIPIESGGEGNINNGATLCKSCHDAVHHWGNGYDEDYESVSEFWSWATNGDS